MWAAVQNSPYSHYFQFETMLVVKVRREAAHFETLVKCVLLGVVCIFRVVACFGYGKFDAQFVGLFVHADKSVCHRHDLHRVAAALLFALP